MKTLSTTTSALVPFSAIESAKAIALATFKDASSKVTLNATKAFNVTMSQLLVRQVQHDLELSEKEAEISALRKPLREAEKALSDAKIRHREVLGAVIYRYQRKHPSASKEEARAFALETIGSSNEYCANFIDELEARQSDLELAQSSLENWKLAHPSPCASITSALKDEVKEAGAKTAQEVWAVVKNFVKDVYSITLNTDTIKYLVPTVDKAISGKRALKAGAPVKETVTLNGFGHRLLAVAIKSNCTSSKWVQVAQRLTAQKN